MIEVLEISQGRFDAGGLPLSETVAHLRNLDEAFLTAHPKCRRWFSPGWRQRMVEETEHAPWGYEWYIVDKNELLKLHSARYDSSG